MGNHDGNLGRDLVELVRKRMTQLCKDIVVVPHADCHAIRANTALLNAHAKLLQELGDTSHLSELDIGERLRGHSEVTVCINEAGEYGCAGKVDGVSVRSECLGACESAGVCDATCVIGNECLEAVILAGHGNKGSIMKELHE